MPSRPSTSRPSMHALLADYDVAILGEVSVSPAQAATLASWVDGGGNLIAMRPDPDLAGLIGLTDSGTDLSEAYLQINTAGGAPGAGLVSQTIQFHGTADRYTLGAGTQSVATLYSSASAATANPAVTLRDVGSNGGQVAAFAFDLARSVVYTRQGNPAWSGQERDGEQPPIIRSDDLFFPNWLDFSKVQIPQADEQQRLLANLIEQMNQDQMPLPRFWYFPRGEKAVVVMTGDDHGTGGTTGQFNYYSSQSPGGCSVANWECIRATSYIFNNTLSDSAAAAFEAQGFEVALHVNTNCGDWTPASLDGFYDDQLGTFGATYPSVPPPSTNRTHCITWSDWATQPKVELDHGIRLDTNYYYWPAAWVQDRPGMFTGSGMPMRFADLDGSLIDVYQAATQMTDESGITYSSHIATLLDNAIGAPGYYGAFTMNMHTDNSSHPGAQTVVAAAIARGVPVVSARQMLQWLDGRNASSFGDLTWNGGTLTFDIGVGANANGLQGMLPVDGPTGELQSLSRNAGAVPFTRQTIKGIEYAVFSAAAGGYTAVYAADTTAPIISDVAADAHGDGTATITWTTDESSDSVVHYGTSSALGQTASTPGDVTAHSVTLTGLTANTTYHFRVSSTDGNANAAESPIAPATATFNAPAASLTDTSLADFGAGTLSNTYLADESGGEVILAPTVGAEFGGSSLPAGWTAGSWEGGGSSTVAGGQLTVNGWWARADLLGAAPRAVEFVATFSGDTFQNAGLGQTLAFGSETWAMFGTAGTAGVLNARINAAGTIIDTPLAGGLLGAPHRYRIEWGASSVRFLVDGALVHTHTGTLSGTLRPIASDFGAGGGALAIDWMRMSPYPAAGSFTSRVFDAGSTVGWQQLTRRRAPPGQYRAGLRSAQRQRGGARCQLEQLRAGHWRRLQPDRPLPAVPRHPADHRQRAEPDPAQRDRQLRRGPGRQHRADHHRPHAAQQRHQRPDRLLRQRHLQ